MRCNAEVSRAILDAISQGPCTMRDAAERAQVGYKAARATIGNLTRAKKLQICGQEKRAHARGWCRLYEVVPLQEPEEVPKAEALGARVLGGAIGNWLR